MRPSLSKGPSPPPAILAHDRLVIAAGEDPPDPDLQFLPLLIWRPPPAGPIIWTCCRWELTTTTGSSSHTRPLGAIGRQILRSERGGER